MWLVKPILIYFKFLMNAYDKLAIGDEEIQGIVLILWLLNVLVPVNGMRAIAGRKKQSIHDGYVVITVS